LSTWDVIHWKFGFKYQSSGQLFQSRLNENGMKDKLTKPINKRKEAWSYDLAN